MVSNTRLLRRLRCQADGAVQGNNRLAGPGGADDAGGTVEIAVDELLLCRVEEHRPLVPWGVERRRHLGLVLDDAKTALRVGVCKAGAVGLLDDADRRSLADGGGQDGLLRLVGEVRGDVQDGLLRCLPHRVEPVLRHAPAQQDVIGLKGEERRPAHCLLDVALGNDLLDGLSDLDDLGGAGPRVAVEAAALGPSVSVVVVADIGEEGVAGPLVEDDAEVEIDAGGPEVLVAGAVDPVEGEAGAVGVLLDVEGGDLGLRSAPAR